MGFSLIFGVSLCLFALADAKMLTENRFREIRPAAPRSRHEIRVLYVQERREEFLEAVESGKRFTKAEIDAMLSPSKETQNMVEQWFLRRGFQIKSRRGDHLILMATAATIKQHLKGRVTLHRHLDSGRMRAWMRDAQVPTELRSVVEGFAGITSLPLSPKRRNVRRVAKDSKLFGSYGSAIPHFLRYLYNISESASAAGASLCLAEFTDYGSYSVPGLAKMLEMTNEPSATINVTVGPTNPSVGALESDLDVQYGVALAKGVSSWFWTEAAWMLEFGQDLLAHPSPPQVVSMSWGWPSNMSCGAENPGGNCGGLDSYQYVLRCETEFAKAAAMGISLFAASGDQGSPGDGFPSCSGGMSDIYPGSSAWVTSVGATELGKNSNSAQAPHAQSVPWGAPICNRLVHFLTKCADGSFTNEVVCSHGTGSLITSGGMFSTYLPMPSWQKSAVQKYLSSGVTLPSSNYYNQSNRAFPDISALGNSYLVWGGFGDEPVAGTSASTPVQAAVTALINAKRLKLGKATIGHVAPHLYSAPSNVFKDITTGNTKCTESCCSKNLGFEATAGYDLASGFGSINYAALEAFLVSLP